MHLIKKVGLTSLFLATVIYCDPASEFSRFFISEAYASGADNASLNVNASVVGKCVFTNGGGDISINMDTYDASGSQATQPLEASELFGINCSKNAVVDFMINDGSHASGSTRRMTGSSGEYLVYDLYKDAAFTQRWGQTTLDGYEHTASSGGPDSITIYAKIPEGQDIAIGDYSDTLTLTVSY